ncbi:rhodanese-like domain-containing protein [Amycolatopsis sp. K13G38]|uniref:Rhodanese-like domain-containing protein n=1 Tax=Amycolatopsis acididurans TaxID=2724524 RepID=A0ABX1IXX9_9PSEU|nr:rhodanese-like domain-containing protein [Amycolatopsis acididurans]NKQ52365.1 rhodanese-like domain-containing protein [Amycolatopsis acididurans]
MSTTKPSTSNTGKLNSAVLHGLLRGDGAPRLLDVRTPGEFQTAHIPGAYNVPLDTLREHRAELREHLDEQVLLICRAGDRASQAQEALAEAGLPNLRVLDGGMLAWEAADYPVVRGKPRWDLERQVRLAAGSIVLVSGLAGFVLPGAHLLGTAVGAGLAAAAVTNTCAMGMVLSKLPYNRGPKTDVKTVIGALAADRSDAAAT